MITFQKVTTESKYRMIGDGGGGGGFVLMEFSFALCKNELIMCFKGSVERKRKNKFCSFRTSRTFHKDAQMQQRKR